MARLTTVNPDTATGETKAMLDAVKGKLGMVPNMMRAMAASPAVLNGYLQFSGALGKGSLPAKLGEQIALVVGEENRCDYCLSAHTAIGGMMKVDGETLTAARRGQSTDAKTQAALQFAKTVAANRGEVTEADFAAVRAAGYSEGEVAEIIAHVALNVLTNYFNVATQTEIDFPKVAAFAR